MGGLGPRTDKKALQGGLDLSVGKRGGEIDLSHMIMYDSICVHYLFLYTKFSLFLFFMYNEVIITHISLKRIALL